MDVPRYAFYRLLRTLGADSFRQFLADLWRARGWTVERDGGTLVVEHPGRGERQTLAVQAVPWWRRRVPPPTPEGADVAVLNRPKPGGAGPVVDAGDLYHMVRYAVDPASRADLLRRHLDRASLPTRLAVRRAPPVSPVRVATVLVAASVLVAAVAGLALLPPVEPVTRSSGDAGAVTPAGDGSGTDAPTETTPARRGQRADAYPPGLSASEVTDPALLAATHAERVADRPRVVTLTVVKVEDSRQWAAYVERIVVADEDTFVSEIETEGDLRGYPSVISGAEVYADGGPVAVHLVSNRLVGREEAVWGAPTDPSAFTDRFQPFVERALSVNGTAVVDTRRRGNETIHNLTGTFAPGLTGTDEHVSASVTSGGTVRSFHYRYEMPVADGFIRISIEYEFGNATVERPAWAEPYAEAD